MGRLAPGDRLGGDLTLVERLGEGGVVEAWIARDRARGTVVVKVLGPEAPEDRKALLEREFELARRLDHPAIVRVLGYVREGGHAWLTLERMSGGDARRLRGGPPADVARALLPVVDALLFAHARGVVHRDLKASNVLLDAGGRGRLADFGHGEALEPDGALPALVGGGSRSGQSPQQLSGEAPDPADDVYSLGALFYDLLAGQPPFWPDFDVETVRRQAPSPLPPHVPERLAELVMAMLAKKRDARPRLEAVRDALREPGAERAGPHRSRHEGRLQPPPRVETVVRPVPMTRGTPVFPSASRPAPGVPASVVAIFGALAVAGVIVFVALPRWVASRSRTAAVESAAAPAPEPTASGSETAAPAPTASGSETATAPPPTKESAEPPRARARHREPDRTEPRSSPALPEDPTDGEFSRAMTEGHRALDRGAFAEARAAFTRAEAARPGAPSAAEGLARAEEGLRTQALALHRSRAEAAEASEDWRGALVEYDAALKLDPQVAFAVQGRPRSQRRAEIDERLAAFLKRPDRLSTEAVAREAEIALAEARDAAPAGPRLREQVASLERRLREARTPVEVRLESDGLTDVTVLRVGGLGAFRDKSLALRPGSYVVTGKRRGYRDVRKTLVVTHEKSPPALLIRCDEAL